MSDSVQLEKVYSPQDVEKRIYADWLSKKYFHAVPDRAKKPYSIVIPPPNITGQLHIGHATDNTFQDILIRWRRMQGYSTLWMPGTDHASIATEAKIVEALEAEGKTKESIGREKFLERAWEWKKEYGGRIVEQLKRIGCSCDWERERFTMDAGLSEAVIEVFVRLYEDGLIYRGERITNWCPGCVTSISDIEVEYEEREGHFWYIRYPVTGGGNESVTVATTRPETMLGDTAVAVNPDDPRYKSLIGKTVILPLMNREIPIIADSYVDAEFGTGAVKITPSHDPNDFDVGMRHNLPQIRVMDDRAVMNENAGKYAGMSREAARLAIVSDLTALGLLEKTEPHVHNVGKCSRCGTTIEPITSAQWFVKMEPLAKPAIDVVKQGKTRFIPDRFAKIYYNWMENIQDWCISRQLWWGHRIPAYYCDSCGGIHVARQAPDGMKCPKCGGALRQDEDVLDTWFSSALWPFSTMGWPKKTELLDYYYPTNVLVTAYDIIFFWVARMIFSGVRHTGREPFEYVFIHGLVRDAEGRKMSKSLGNGVDPLEFIDEFGADALRFALTTGSASGNDLRFSEDKTKAARNFANKLWNASRFVLMNTGGGNAKKADMARLTAADRWILSELNKVINDVTDSLERFELGMALSRVYDFVWDMFCDWYIEFVKPRLSGGSASGGSASGGSEDGNPAGSGAAGDVSSLYAGADEAVAVLRYVLVQSLKLLHPFMPFITEEIYQAVAKSGGSDMSGEVVIADTVLTDTSLADSIMIDKWPVAVKAFESPADVQKTAFIIESIRALRNLRAEMNVAPSTKFSCVFVTDVSVKKEALEESSAFLKRLAGIKAFSVSDDRAGLPTGAIPAGAVPAGAVPADAVPADAITLVAGGAEIFIPMGELVDIEKERARLKKELGVLENEIKRAGERLANPGFTSKAPARVIDEMREKLEKYEDAYKKVGENLKRII